MTRKIAKKGLNSHFQQLYFLIFATHITVPTPQFYNRIYLKVPTV